MNCSGHFETKNHKGITITKDPGIGSEILTKETKRR